MKNKCLKKFEELQRRIDEFQLPSKKIFQNDGSYEKLRFIKDNCFLKEYMDEMGVMELLRDELEEFLKFYDPSYLKESFYLKQIKIKECTFMKVLEKYYYLLSCYLGDVDLYRDFPAFMKALIDNYTPENEHLTYKNYYDGFLGFDMMKYREGYDTKYKRVLVEHSFPSSSNLYEKYEEDMRREIPNYNREGSFWRWAERDTFMKEKQYIESKLIYNTNQIVRWVSRFDGDGYGYDVLSYDHEKRREKLIEVKTTEGERFYISNDEVRKAYKSTENENCDYYIYGYIHGSDDKPLLKKLKFDKEKFYFINIDDPEDIYYISAEMYPKKDNDEYKYNADTQLFVEPKAYYEREKNKKIYVKEK